MSVRGEHRTVPLILRVLWRYFFSGRALSGPGDNATMFHHATVDYRARPYITLSRRKWERLARRHAAITIPLLLTVLAIHPDISLWWAKIYILSGLSVVTIWGGRRTWRSVRDRREAREWTDPAARVLCRLVDVRYTRKRGRQMVELPRGWGKGVDTEDMSGRPAVRIHIPAGTPLDTRIKGRITENVGARLGIPAPVQATWSEAGEHITADLSAAPLPPKDVSMDAMLKAAGRMDDDQVLLGQKAGGRHVSASLSEDSPHFLMSGAAGTGKSVLARWFMIQRMLRGDGMIILDPKKFSHWRWAGGGKLSRDIVIYAYRDEDLHETWMAIGEEIKRRIELDEDELAGQRRVFVMVEEANVQVKKLQRYWRGVRKGIIAEAKLRLADDPAADVDLGDLDPPVQSPAVVAMQEAVCMGRELRMHVVVAAQRASANVFGGNGGDIRESFQGGRMIARWDRKLWKMLVDTIAYVACPSGPRGIWGIARGEEFEIFRVPFLPEARALALLRDAPPSTGPVLGPQTARPVEAAPRHSEAVTLAQALPRLPGPAMSIDALRKAAQRPGFPAPLELEYGPREARQYDWDAVLTWREMALEQA